VIINLFTGDCYSAIKCRGAYKNGIPIIVNNNSDIRKSMFGISLSLGEPLYNFANRYKVLFKTSLRIRSFGTNALGLCLLAEGALDTFMDLQIKTRPFDIAAGYLILKEAGGYLWSLKPNHHDNMKPASVKSKNINNMPADLDCELDINSRISFLCSNKGLRDYFLKIIPEIIEMHKRQPPYRP